MSLPALNTGVVVLNDKPMAAGETATFCVLGMPRGGTTMAARLLQAAGIFMGDNLSVTAEDATVNNLLRDSEPDQQAFRELVAERRARLGRWGFKSPFRNHWKLLASIEDARFLVVFRDVLAVANRNRMSGGAELLSSIQANLDLQIQLARFAEHSTRPMLMFSYEKALIAPAAISDAILDFAGAEQNEENRSRLRSLIEPNEPQYVDQQSPGRRMDVICVDVATRSRIAGWARGPNGNSVALEIWINGKMIARSRADSKRPDLAQRFRNDGRYAFDIAFRPEDVPAAGDLEIRRMSDGSVLFRQVLK